MVARRASTSAAGSSRSAEANDCNAASLRIRSCRRASARPPIAAATVGSCPLPVAQVSRSSPGGHPVPRIVFSARTISAAAVVLVDSRVLMVSRAASICRPITSRAASPASRCRWTASRGAELDQACVTPGTTWPSSSEPSDRDCRTAAVSSCQARRPRTSTSVSSSTTATGSSWPSRRAVSATVARVRDPLNAVIGARRSSNRPGRRRWRRSASRRPGRGCARPARGWRPGTGTADDPPRPPRPGRFPSAQTAVGQRRRIAVAGSSAGKRRRRLVDDVRDAPDRIAVHGQRGSRHGRSSRMCRVGCCRTGSCRVKPDPGTGMRRRVRAGCGRNSDMWTNGGGLVGRAARWLRRGTDRRHTDAVPLPGTMRA